jgi:hypothetical protein
MKTIILIFITLICVIVIVSCKSEEQKLAEARAEAKQKKIKDSIELVKYDSSVRDMYVRHGLNYDSIHKRAVNSSKVINDLATKMGWNYNDCEKVLNHEIWIGMTYAMLKYERGNPDRVNVSNYGHGDTYQYCWNDKKPPCFYVQNGIVTAYN